ncbi:MAG: hemerythrin domain-containing protein [bacterium]|nr:hemerythrin domain-containing protein [bacterium]
MPRATDQLRADHAVVQSGLAVLGAIAKHVRAGSQFPTADVATSLRFLREFLVGVHFRKENEVVWPALAMRGSEASSAAVGDLVLRADEAHELVQTLVYFWEPAGELTAAESRGFADTVDTLQHALAELQEREEELFGDCEVTIPADDLLGWNQEFDAIAAGRPLRADWQRELAVLADRWR